MTLFEAEMMISALGEKILLLEEHGDYFQEVLEGDIFPLPSDDDIEHE